MNTSAVITIFLMIVISGCASVPEHAVEADVPSRKVERSMERIALEVRDELRLLAKIRDERRQREMTDNEKQEREREAAVADLPDVMKERVSLIIPAKEAGEMCVLLADMMSYKSITEGTEPAQTIWTRMNIKDEPLYSAIYELGRQTGTAFDMEIYPNAALVRCVYKAEVN